MEYHTTSPKNSPYEVCSILYSMRKQAQQLLLLKSKPTLSTKYKYDPEPWVIGVFNIAILLHCNYYKNNTSTVRHSYNSPKYPEKSNESAFRLLLRDSLY